MVTGGDQFEATRAGNEIYDESERHLILTSNQNERKNIFVPSP